MNRGFSLIELSVVLVILALLAGAILGGQALLKASELRAVSTEFRQFATALNTFKTKYNAIPGDMHNATRYWGDDPALCADPNVDDGQPGVCNGDGDSYIETAGAALGTGEEFMFWKHLALAGLIEGNYTGTAGSASQWHAQIGINVPASTFPDAGWSAKHANTMNAGSSFFTDYNNHLVFGAEGSSGETILRILTPTEAWNIDKKVDDGKPGRGDLLAIGWDDDCSFAIDGSSAGDDFDAEYNISSDDVRCAFRYRNLF